ncbi:MAG: hypothetical protein WAX07_09025 [Candidatus Altiarchaeia archaeon]
MKTGVFTGTLVFLTIFSCTASAVSGSYNFLALNYGMMWSQYASAVEGKDIGDKNCPVAVGISMDGYAKKTVYCSIFGVNTRITIPEDVKLVTSDGYVVADEMCVGEKFTLAKGASKGEYWDDGGDMDSPPVYWIADVEAVVNKLVSQHKSASPAKVGGTKVADGYVDPLTGIPVYNVDLKGNASGTGFLEHYNIIGNLACSMKGTANPSGNLAQAGEYYQATAAGDASFQADYTVECIYYYYGGICDPASDMCGGTDAFCQYQVPMFPKMSGKSLKDLVKVGTISVKKNIKITQAGDAKAEFSISGAQAASVGEQINLRVLVKNTGTANMTIKTISSRAPHKFVSCDSSIVAPGKETECILSVTPSADDGLDVTVGYEYKSCGRTKSGQVSKTVLGTARIMPKEAYQVYGIEVKGDCKNAYYACDAPKDGMLSVGYRCMEQSYYYTPSAGRADMEYDISSFAAGTEISVASLRIKPAVVNKPQKIGAFVYNFGLEPVSCSAGGDICTQPYCKECEPLYNIPGDAIASQEISTAQAYSLDVTEYVRKAVNNGDKVISFQLRGEENLWDTQGASQCGSDGYWTKQDVSIPATGADAPALEIVIK